MNPMLTDMPLETALYRGLGRAVLFLEENHAPNYREAILDCILFNRVYDPQFNRDRADYLFDVIHATGEPEYYARHIREALRTGNHRGYDAGNIYEIAGRLVKNGDTATRQAMYDGLPERLDDGSGVGIRPLIQLDGIAAYIVIAERLMTSEPDDEALREKHHYFPLIDLAEQVGEAGLPMAVEMTQEANPRLTGYLNRLLAVRQNCLRENEQWRTDRRQPRTYEEVTAYLEGRNGARYVGPLSFARLEENIRRRVAEQLLRQTETEPLIRYLKLFTHSPFPMDHTPLFTLTRHDDRKIAHLAYRVLENTSHPTVRTYALELFAEKRAEYARYVIWLLTNNPGEDDLTRIVSLTTGVEDEEELHSLYMAARYYLEANPTVEAVPFLLEMYRETPCATCRRGIVGQLDDLDALPNWFYEEGIYDSESDIRERAASGTSTQN